MAKLTAQEHAELLNKQSRISVERYFEVSLLLMLATAFLTITATRKLDLPSTVGVFAALVLRLWSYFRDRDWSLGPRTVTRIAIFYVFFYGLDFFLFTPGPTLLDHMLGATVHLILFATVIKVFSARTYRDYGYLATLSFMMMLSSALLTVSTVFVACFVFYVLFSISTFISYEIKRSMEAAARPAEGPYFSAAANRRAIEKALGSTAGGLAVGIVALASVLFFVIPRYRTGYLTNLGAERQNITGFSESVNLGDIRKILLSNQVVMRVIPRDSPRQLAGLKWRGVALTSFDGKHWYNDNTEQASILPASYAPGGVQRILLPRAEGWQARSRKPLGYRVIVAPLTTDVIFAAAVPRELVSHLRFVTLDETESMHNPQHGYSPFGYEVVSETGLPSPEELRRASPDVPADLRLVYLRLPPTLDARVESLTRRLIANSGNNYDRARAVETYLRDNFRYTLDPPAIEPKDPVASFLFKSKAGYCEYFAAAMAVMLRTVGIPTRLVNGFQTGVYNSFGRDYVVRARDAHSWVEVYFNGWGWIPFDPTPADPNAAANAWSALDDYLDAAGLFWNEWIINYDFSRQVELARDVEQQSRLFHDAIDRRFQSFKYGAVRNSFRFERWLNTHKVWVLVGMILVLAFLVVEEKSLTLEDLRLFIAWKFHRGSYPMDAAKAALTYRRFLKVLEKKGHRKPPAETPREFAAMLKASRFGPGAAEFTRLYNTFRFGAQAAPLPRLRELLEQLRRL